MPDRRGESLPNYFIFAENLVNCQSMIDLHTHSSASDGSFSPAALVEKAAAGGISAIALTDHDTIAGLAEAREAAALKGVAFIPGVELQINWKGEAGGEFHLLGLGISRPAEDFTAAVAELAAARENRNLEILERMKEFSIEVSYEDIKALSGGDVVGRPHFAVFLVQRRIVKNIKQAFSRYLGHGRPFYVPKAGLDFDRMTAAIKESGGIAVLAHPMSLYTAWGRLPGLIKNLKERGLDGLEAWHPTAKTRDCRRLDELGKSLGLFVTAGSDFHGEARPDRKLGVTSGGKKIDESVLEAIPALKPYVGLCGP